MVSRPAHLPAAFPMFGHRVVAPSQVGTAAGLPLSWEELLYKCCREPFFLPWTPLEKSLERCSTWKLYVGLLVLILPAGNTVRGNKFNAAF